LALGHSVVGARASVVVVCADEDMRVRLRSQLSDVGLCEHGMFQCKVYGNAEK
jgi:hypothetical protein